jgi:hypothetical protein
MSTIKQKRALEKLVENGGNVTQAMRDVGYSEGTVNNPSNLTHSKGCKEILNDCGLTENLVVESLISDIKNKPNERLRELALASDILGIKDKTLFSSGKGIEIGKRNESLEREMAYIFEVYYKAKLSGHSQVMISIPS